jgi:hypothetical protein
VLVTGLQSPMLVITFANYDNPTITTPKNSGMVTAVSNMFAKWCIQADNTFSQVLSLSMCNPVTVPAANDPNHEKSSKLVNKLKQLLFKNPTQPRTITFHYPSQYGQPDFFKVGNPPNDLAVQCQLKTVQ